MKTNKGEPPQCCISEHVATFVLGNREPFTALRRGVGAKGRLVLFQPPVQLYEMLVRKGKTGSLEHGTHRMQF